MAQNKSVVNTPHASKPLSKRPRPVNRKGSPTGLTPRDTTSASPTKRKSTRQPKPGAATKQPVADNRTLQKDELGREVFSLDKQVKAVSQTQAERTEFRASAKPVTRKDMQQRERVQKKNEADKKIRAKNKELALKGKKTKADPSDHIPSLWEKMAEPELYTMLRHMGDTYNAIDKFQRKRVMFSVFIALFGILGGYFIHFFVYLVGFIGAFVIYKMQFKRVSSFYNGWKFMRQLNFSKFTRLLIPYLKASGGATALYTIFNKILNRTDDPVDRRNLYQLMGEMGDNPQNIEPFLAYAERTSGTDMSHLFMSTIFDFQQSTFDVSVIDELGQMASEDMMNAIDEIINFKLRRFVMFPTKVVMSSFILVVGLGAGLMIHNFQNIGFSGDMLQPMDQQQSAQEVTTEGEVSETPTEQAVNDEVSSEDEPWYVPRDETDESTNDTVVDTSVIDAPPNGVDE